MSHEISNSDDVIDSRDVIARIEELHTELEDAHEGEGNGGELVAWIKSAADDSHHTLQEAASEYVALLALQEEAEGYAPDWQHGATLIRDSYFKDYAMDLAEDIGALPKDHTWPAYCIDWDWAARDLQMDYTSVEFDGVTYWVR